MVPHWVYRAVLCFLLCAVIVDARNIDLWKRQQDGRDVTAPVTTGASPTETGRVSGTVTGTARTLPSSTNIPTVTAIPDDPMRPINITALNITIPDGQLPLQPQITPGWGVAGTILMLTGGVYAMIGIKQDRLHAFFSVAFLCGMGITVLLLYVTELPISNAIQGAYVVAAIVGGIVLGCVSLVFNDIIECAGCFLGGFCLAMWLLTAKEDGLVSGVAARGIFIACFSIATTLLYISKYTRDYCLMISIALSGATAMVIGIDCFSRAGLKEFWAWLWSVNPDLFPTGAEYYPITKGMRVEHSVTMIIAFIGIVSQLRLWRIIKQGREKRVAELAEVQRKDDEEEETIGRQLRETNNREKAQWERIYGNGPTDGTATGETSPTLGGDTEGHEKFTQYQVSGDRDSDSTGSRRDLTTSPQTNKGVGVVTIRVGQNEQGQDATPYDGTTARALTSKKLPPTPIPAVVPLPFRVPTGSQNTREEPQVQVNADNIDDGDNDGRSSVATLADEDANRLQRELSRPATAVTKADGEAETNASDVEAKEAESKETRSLAEKEESGEAAVKTETDAKQPVNKAETNADDTEEGRAVVSNAENVAAADTTTAPASVSMSLTQERLPQALSRVALSYRTNEWAKHLSHAETPEMDDLEGGEIAGSKESTGDSPTGTNPTDSSSSSSVAMDGIDEEPGMQVEYAVPVNPEQLLNRPGIVGAEEPGSKRSPNASGRSGRDRDNRSNNGSPTKGRVSVSFAPKGDEYYGSGSPMSGIMPYSNPRTLLGQRESYYRSKSQIALPMPQQPNHYSYGTSASASRQSLQRLQRTPSNGSSAYGLGVGHHSNSSASINGAPAGDAGDDVPLSQRREMIRQNSLPMGAVDGISGSRSPSLDGYDSETQIMPHPIGPEVSAASAAFDSHQPRRSAMLTPAARESQLAVFRRSVAYDLQAGAALQPGANAPTNRNSNTIHGWESPLAAAAAASSMYSVGLGQYGRAGEVQRGIESRRSMMMSQKDAEAQRRMLELGEKEYMERMFEERMRTGDLAGAHREAMKRMQATAKH